MSIHPSLSSSLKSRKQRSVLNRLERIKYLKEKGLFNDQASVYGLPKIKFVKIKIKKEKAAEKTAAVAATGTAPEAAVDSKQVEKPAAKTAPSGKPAK